MGSRVRMKEKKVLQRGCDQNLLEVAVILNDVHTLMLELIEPF